MTNRAFLHLVREQALAHTEEFVEALKWMKEPGSLERIENDPKYAVVHPYWHGTPEEREAALKIMDAQMELLRALFPKQEKAI
jgi:hypothetical protein